MADDVLDLRYHGPEVVDKAVFLPPERRLTWRDRITRSAASFLDRQFEIRTKSYSLVPVERATNYVLNPQRNQRPNDELLLRAFGDNPWLRIKYQRLCASLASLDIQIFEKTRNGAMLALTDDYPMYQLIRRPNPLMFGWDFRFLTELYMRVAGACFWRPVFDIFGVPRQLWLYPAHWVIIIRNPRTWEIVYYDVRQPNGYIERLGPHELLWLRSPDPLNPYFKGLGEAVALSTEIDTFELASESDRRFFENDASPKGALIVPGSPSAEEQKRIKDDWKSKMGAPENYGETAILGGGMDYKTFREGRREMDFIEGQKYLRDTILTGVHPHIVGIAENVNRANAEAAEYTFGKWEISPRVQWWTEVYNTMLAPFFHDSIVVQFEDPVPEDREFILRRSQVGMQIGAIQRNEWRKDNSYPLLPAELGDVFLMSPMINEVPGEPLTDEEDIGAFSKIGSEPGGRPGDVVDMSTGQPTRRPGQQVPPNTGGPSGGGAGRGGGQGGTPGGTPESMGGLISPTGPAGAQAPVLTEAGRRAEIRRKTKVKDDSVLAFKAFTGEFARMLIEKLDSGTEVYVQPPEKGRSVWFSTAEQAMDEVGQAEEVVVVKARISKAGTTDPVRIERAEP